MSTRYTLLFVVRIIVLTILLAACWTVAGLAVGLADSSQPGSQAGAMTALLSMCAMHAIVISYPLERSRWGGWRLVLTILVVYYGIVTFLSQIETLVFLKYLVDIVPAEMVPKFFMHGLIVAVVFAPLAVLVHGKIKGAAEAQEPNPRLVMPWTQWLWKVLLVAVVYVVIYVAFGALVFMPLAGAAYEEYYAGLQMPSWILPFQVLRGLLWIGVALPVIRMMKGAWWEAGLAVALLFSVLMSGTLLLPNEFMPAEIRRAHFVEVSSSNFLFGWIVVWVFHRRHGLRREPSQAQEADSS
ncbi:MAG: hypothetical protein ACETWG_02450 [Candidatus Neomarinimicrobiota bacterium]